MSSIVFLNVAAAVVAIIGVAVLLGWRMHIPFLVQIRPDWVPMQPNTAAGFILVSIAVVAVPFVKWAARILSLLVGIIGALAILQYESGNDLGFNRILIEPWEDTKTHSPGLMAAATAWNFVLLALSTITATLRKWETAWRAGAACSTIAVALSVKVLIEQYWFEWHKLWDVGEPTLQAFHTAVAFIVIGCSLVAYHDSRLHG